MKWKVVLLFFCTIVGCRGALCPDKVCNNYVEGRICNADTDEKGKWSSNETHLNIGVMKGLSGWEANTYQNVDLAVMCAINKTKTEGLIFPGIDIQPVFLDDQSSEAGGIEASLCMKHGGIPWAVGPLSSGIATNAAIIGKIFQLNQIGYAASSPVLSNAHDFPFFSRVFPSDAYQGLLLARLSHKFGWKSVATISESPQPYYDGIVNAFADEARKLGIYTSLNTVTDDAETYQSQIKFALEKVKSENIRIILLALGSDEEALQLAKEAEMIGNGYAFIGPEGLVSSASTLDIDLIDGFIGLNPAIDTASSGYHDFVDCFERSKQVTDPSDRFFNMTVQEYSLTGYFLFAYDATLLLLNALWESKQESNSFFQNSTLVRSKIRSVVVNGGSGTIKLDENGDRTGAQYDIVNVRKENGNRVVKVVGSIDTSDMNINIDEAVYFYGGSTTPPADRYFGRCIANKEWIVELAPTCENSERVISFTARNSDVLRYCPLLNKTVLSCDHPEAGSLGQIVSTIGLFINTLFLVALLRTWTESIIVRSQKQMLLLTIIGGILGQAFIVSLSTEPTTVTCAMTPFVLSTSFILVFGPLFLKSWRVSLIMNNRSMKRMAIKNSTLYGRMIMLLLVNTAIGIAMMGTDPPMPHSVPHTVRIDDYYTTASVDINVCAASGGDLGSIWIFYIGLQMMYGCYISFCIRNVTSDLSEAKWMFIAIYNGAVWGLITCLLVFGIAGLSSLQIYNFIALGTTITSVVTVALIMGPKLLNIYHGIQLSISGPRGSTGVSTAITATTVVPGNMDIVEKLRQQLRENGIQPLF